MLAVTVITAVPRLMPTTLPVVDTVATDSSELLYINVGCLPSADSFVTVTFTVFKTLSSSCEYAVIVVVPIPRAVITPLYTDATNASSDFQRITSSFASGVTFFVVIVFVVLHSIDTSESLRSKLVIFVIAGVSAVVRSGILL